MTIGSSPASRRSRPLRRSLVRWAIGLVLLGAVFAAGVAVGQALEDRPPAGKPVTNISTIRPWTQKQP